MKLWDSVYVPIVIVKNVTVGIAVNTIVPATFVNAANVNAAGM